MCVSVWIRWIIVLIIHGANKQQLVTWLLIFGKKLPRVGKVGEENEKFEICNILKNIRFYHLWWRFDLWCIYCLSTRVGSRRESRPVRVNFEKIKTRIGCSSLMAINLTAVQHDSVLNYQKYAWEGKRGC